MTKILLTSAGMNMGKEIHTILPKPSRELKLAHIITASTPEVNKEYVIKDRERMMTMGFDVENIDIEGKSEDTLRKILENKDIVYVQGGDTFYLLKQVQSSGFDTIVKEHVNKGKLYIGVSAGSYIACPTIEQSLWKHKGKNQYGLTDLSALNLVPFLIFAHFKEENRELVEKGASGTKYPVVALSDTQAVLVIDGRWKVVGEGKREFYNGFVETLI